MIRNQPDKWVKLVEAVRSLGADPRDYVEAAVGVVRCGWSQPPEPSRLCGPAAEQAWRDYVANLAASLAGRLHSQMQRLAGAIRTYALSGLSPPDAALGALTEPLAGFDAVFGYCALAALAAEHPSCRRRASRAAADWRAGAVALYRRCPREYDRAWGEFLAEDLRRAAA